MFHYFKISYFTCTVFIKFTYNEHIGPYFLSHVVLRFSPVNSPRSFGDTRSIFCAFPSFTVLSNSSLCRLIRAPSSLSRCQIVIHKYSRDHFDGLKCSHDLLIESWFVVTNNGWTWSVLILISRCAIPYHHVRFAYMVDCPKLLVCHNQDY